jgi:hypothetical protein
MPNILQSQEICHKVREHQQNQQTQALANEANGKGQTELTRKACRENAEKQHNFA